MRRKRRTRRETEQRLDRSKRACDSDCRVSRRSNEAHGTEVKRQSHAVHTANHIYEMTLRHFWIHYLTPQRGRRGANTPPLCEVTHCSSGSPRSRPTGLPWGDTCYSSSNFANSRIEFAKSIWWSTGHEVGSSSAASNPLPWPTLSQARRLVVWGVVQCATLAC